MPQAVKLDQRLGIQLLAQRLNLRRGVVNLLLPRLHHHLGRHRVRFGSPDASAHGLLELAG